ncbi:hypothetical protein R1flu_015126 [Riccia fluitans]|uniref:YDG domain-containing protein n=1 Tax=Riccia fluitans TaxID=41844 RepID=A0ABD1YIE4_9MARC
MYADLEKNKNTIGSIKGISVGDTYGLSIEMSVIGLHKELIADVNIVMHCGGDLDPIATSVVLMLGSSYPGNEYKQGGGELVYCEEGRVFDGHNDLKLSAEVTAFINSKDRDIHIVESNNQLPLIFLSINVGIGFRKHVIAANSGW